LIVGLNKGFEQDPVISQDGALKAIVIEAQGGPDIQLKEVIFRPSPASPGRGRGNPARAGCRHPRRLIARQPKCRVFDYRRRRAGRISAGHGVTGLEVGDRAAGILVGSYAAGHSGRPRLACPCPRLVANGRQSHYAGADGQPFRRRQLCRSGPGDAALVHAARRGCGHPTDANDQHFGLHRGSAGCPVPTRWRIARTAGADAVSVAGMGVSRRRCGRLPAARASTWSYDAPRGNPSATRSPAAPTACSTAMGPLMSRCRRSTIFGLRRGARHLSMVMPSVRDAWALSRIEQLFKWVPRRASSNQIGSRYRGPKPPVRIRTASPTALPANTRLPIAGGIAPDEKTRRGIPAYRARGCCHRLPSYTLWQLVNSTKSVSAACAGAASWRCRKHFAEKGGGLRGI